MHPPCGGHAAIRGPCHTIYTDLPPAETLEASVRPIGSAGVFMIRGADKRLMAYAGEASNPRRWEIIQHDGFHQFADATIGQLPPWINEGLAEYFRRGDLDRRRSRHRHT